jgi:hypothetical protein
MNDKPEYRAMLSYDIESYSTRNNADQYALQAAMIRLLDLAAGAAGLGLLDWKRQPQGDGEFVVLPDTIHPARLTGAFADALRAALDDYNASSGPRLRLRLAVHAGPLHVDGPAGSPGRHAVASGRLVDAGPLRAALRVIQEASLGIVVSEEFYRDYVGQGYGGPEPDRFRHVVVKVKQQQYDAYVYLPGHDVHAIDDLETGQDGSGDQPRAPGGVSVGGDWYGGSVVNTSGQGVSYVAGRDITMPERKPQR